MPDDKCISVESLSKMVADIEGVDQNAPGYQFRKGWNAALRCAMDYAGPAPAAQPAMPTCGDCTITSESAEPKAKAERAAEGRADNPESPARSASADGAVSASVAQPVMPEPFDWCYEWDGPYGTRKFSAAPHNGARCDRSVALYNADQMHAYASALSEARCAQLQAQVAQMREALHKIALMDHGNPYAKDCADTARAALNAARKGQSHE